jgi:hypothetical protein
MSKDRACLDEAKHQDSTMFTQIKQYATTPPLSDALRSICGRCKRPATSAAEGCGKGGVKSNLQRTLTSTRSKPGRVCRNTISRSLAREGRQKPLAHPIWRKLNTLGHSHAALASPIHMLLQMDRRDGDFHRGATAFLR